jgi:hypothetical protein
VMAPVWLLRRAAMLMIRVRMVAARALLRAGAASVAAGPGEVVGDRGQRQPGGVGGELSGWQVCEGRSRT